MARTLGPEKGITYFSWISRLWHVSCFSRRVKRSAWAVLNAFSQLTQPWLISSLQQLMLMKKPCKPLRELSSCSMSEAAQQQISTRLAGNYLQRRIMFRWFSPTGEALGQHVKRAVYQGRHVWGQNLVPVPTLPPPTHWSWVKATDCLYQPNWRTSEALKVYQEHISCIYVII